MRTKYCPHCGSENIERIEEDQVVFNIDAGILTYPPTHYHECKDCQEAWDHHESK